MEWTTNPRTAADMTWILGRSPLVVFLLLGASVFAVDRWLDDAGAGRVVTVTEEQLGAIRERWAAQWGRPPTGRELEGLIDEAVREEILYREARRRGLDRGDAIIRRRLAQKMMFLLEDSAEAPARGAGAGDIETYFAAHAERYHEPRRTTFRHVFLSRERRDPAREATAQLRELRAGGGDAWRQLGDPLPAAPGVRGPDRPGDRGAVRGRVRVGPARPRGRGMARTGRIGARRSPRPGDRSHRAAGARPRRGPGWGGGGPAGEPAARAERGGAADPSRTLRDPDARIGGRWTGARAGARPGAVTEDHTGPRRVPASRHPLPFPGTTTDHEDRSAAGARRAVIVMPWFRGPR